MIASLMRKKFEKINEMFPIASFGYYVPRLKKIIRDNFL